ncbi:FlgO family outer membrane protein [Rheinheimera maricola]|uniref:FlgO domain-containing protein n=1 Tax=Rheinheimera maricola TaxID=2793282 RepID=A0ABS7X638_9GAMM|nr:FlgO family outer membrane protein [Rheinheimera maricola]MBZ9610183.1 hypothetical protein [Rheinheimera maricola]
MQKLTMALAFSLLLVTCPGSSAVSNYDHIVHPNNVFQDSYTPGRHKLSLANYVEQMVLSLKRNGTVPTEGSIAVASFVDFDASLTHSHALGNQLAENFITQLQKFGYNVNETKANGKLIIDSKGDFVFSRKKRTRFTRTNYCCVLTGTLIYAPTGIEVNTRLFNTRDNSLISSSQTTIPYFVTRHLGVVVR